MNQIKSFVPLIQADFHLHCPVFEVTVGIPYFLEYKPALNKRRSRLHAGGKQGCYYNKRRSRTNAGAWQND